jgi:uncharacterized protein (AIM24 family)
MRSELFAESREVEPTSNFTLQNHKMLKCVLGPEVLARQGSMVAYQGNVGFDHQGGGLARFVKQWATGEGVPLMRCSGQGEVFFADKAKDVTLLYLENDGITMNGPSVLAFDASLHWDIAMIQGMAGVGGHGLFNVVVQGTGWVALTSIGVPLVLDVNPSSQTFADADAVVAWSTNLRTSVASSVTVGGSMFGQGSGEGWNMRFEGMNGFVVVQPAEPPPLPGQTGPAAGNPFGGAGRMGF